MSNSNVASKTDLVKLQSRKTSNGRASLYLDYVQYDVRVRDTLGLYLLSGKSPEVKAKNQKTMAKAEMLRLEKERNSWLVLLRKRILTAKPCSSLPAPANRA